MSLLEGKVALVTGASRDIGAAIAKTLGQAGAKVAVNYNNNEAAAQSVVKEIESNGGKALAVKADVGDNEQVAAMVKQVEAELGSIDILVLNAAAVKHVTIKSFLDFSLDEFDAMVNGEIKAVLYPSKIVAPLMIERKQGCIIAISSGLARVPYNGYVGHSVGKAGVEALVRSMAYELGQFGIRVNTVSPGLVETEASMANHTPESLGMMTYLTPLGRIGKPEDVAGAVLMLASDHSRYITGGYINVSGGFSIS